MPKLSTNALFVNHQTLVRPQRHKGTETHRDLLGKNSKRFFVRLSVLVSL
jgi:hypothetical protein